MMRGKTEDELSFNSTPNTTKLFTDFMHKSGTLRNLPKTWKRLVREQLGQARELIDDPNVNSTALEQPPIPSAQNEAHQLFFEGVGSREQHP
jgi:hypothetical protein